MCIAIRYPTCNPPRSTRARARTYSLAFPTKKSRSDKGYLGRVVITALVGGASSYQEKEDAVAGLAQPSLFRAQGAADLVQSSLFRAQGAADLAQPSLFRAQGAADLVQPSLFRAQGAADLVQSSL